MMKNGKLKSNWVIGILLIGREKNLASHEMKFQIGRFPNSLDFKYLTTYLHT